MVQSSAWSGFRYDFLNAHGESVGGFEFPNMGQARNARLRVHPPGSTAGDIRLVLGGSSQQSYRVDFEYLSRSWANDLRYRLLHGNEVLAEVDILRVSGRRWPDINLRAYPGTQTARMTSTGRWWRSIFELHEPDGTLLARIEEPAALTLRRRYLIDGERLPLAVKAFLGVVVVSLRL